MRPITILTEYSLEGLMLKLKLQYFDHLMCIDDSFEKSLMLGKMKGRRKRGHQRMRWLDSITGEHQLGQTPGAGEGQGGLACCSPWSHKVSDTTGCLNNNNNHTNNQNRQKYYKKWKVQTNISHNAKILNKILENKTKNVEKNLYHNQVGFLPAMQGLFNIRNINNNNVIYYACVYAKSLQLCPTLCDPIGYSPPGSCVHGILKARELEWVSMPSSRGFSWTMDQTQVSYISCTGRQVLYH